MGFGRSNLDAGCRALIALLALIVQGCALPPPAPTSALALKVTAPVLIPAGQAHAILQSGRLAGAADRNAPYCELEVRQVSSAEPQRVTEGDFQVRSIRQSVLLDPTTRLPAFVFGSSCSDPLYQESLWMLRSEVPSDVLYLRCIAPYFNCTFGPPLTPEQVQQQVGRYLQIRRAEPTTPP